MATASIHDSGYKVLFSNRTIFRQLMESFVDQPWVKQLDFDRAERIDKSFIDEAYQERESDLIYRIPLGEEEVYIYVLLEFQSTVDRLMALRVLNYVVNFYMDLTRNRTNLQKLPAVFPIVLYNGEGRWTAATDIADLIEAVPGLGEYALHFRYFNLVENDLSQERLLKIGNIVSTLFLAETRYEYRRLLAELIALFEREEDKQAASLLVNWFRQMTLHNRIRREDYAQLYEAYRSTEEVNSVFSTTVEKQRQEWREEGLEEGREKGREEGRKAAMQQIVLGMVQHGISVAVIADVAGISIADVETIIAQPKSAQDASSET